MPSWKKVIVSGSDAFLNALTVTNGITGSLHGTASWAQNAITSSYTLNAVSASFASTASYVLNAVSSSYAATASSADTFLIRTNLTASGLKYPTVDGLVNQSIITDGAGNLLFGNPYSSNTIVYGKNLSGGTIAKGTPLYFTGSGTSGNLVGVYPADASNPARMPAAGVAGEQLLDEAEGVILLDGFISGVNTSAFSSGDPVYVAVGGGYTNIKPTGSTILIQALGYVEKSAINGSGVIQGSGRANDVPNIQQGYTWVGNANGVATPTATSSIQNVISSSYAGFAETIASGLNITASNLQVINNITASSISATSASFGYVQSVTGSAVIIGQEYIILNTQTPAARYAGLQIYDSGSNSTASIVWDSLTNHFVYENASGSSYSGGGFMAGPRNTGSLADITYPTLNRVLRGQGGDHLYDSNIFDDDTAIRLEINTQVTGSLNVSGGITGSLYGTASWAENAITASYVLNAVSASYAANALSSSFATSASLAQTSNTASYVLNAVSSSYSDFALSSSQATSSSFATNASSSLVAITASYALFAANGGGGGGGGATVVLTQLTASTTWSFSHNLNTLTPLLQVYDLGYEQIIPNEIVSIDAFTSEIRFDYTQAGYAVASSGGGLVITGSTPRLVQTVAATTWSFAHNLGTQFPGFEVFDQNDYVVIPAGIYAVDENNAEIYFATPSTGVAIANFSGIDGVIPAATSASYAATASLALTAISSSYAATASYSDAFSIGQTLTRYATVTSSINGSNTVFTQATGSYTSAFFKYTVTSGSNARSGEIMSVWNGITSAFTDNSTTDIGTTTDVTSSVAISGTNVQLNMQTNSSGWRIKSIATFM
jgi:hypothetical protein